ncbi:MAG: hypothetical protein ACNI27_17095 [Desulfovibrio sp.]
MYYYGFDKKFQTDANWTMHDDQLVSMLFSKIINKTVTTDSEAGETQQQEGLIDDMVNNLFDLCLYISSDVRDC